jgi:glutamate synthase (NADPH) small chain
MGELGGFLRLARGPPNERDPTDRGGDYREILVVLSPEIVRDEGARCMDWRPLLSRRLPARNRIPEWNDLTYRG